MVTNSVCAVIVTYNPDEALIQNIGVTAKQVQQVVIVDNASQEKGKKLLTEVKNLHPHTKIIYNSENVGLATALNQGVKYAIKENYEWVLTLDQDSFPEENMVETMLKVYNQVEEKQEIVSLAPRFFNQGVLEKDATNVKTDAPYNFVKRVITSGNLVKTEVFKKLGLFEDKLFIDFIDHEFCLRLCAYDLKIIQVKDSYLNHNLGVIRKHNFLGKEIHIVHHSPLRKYYGARNSVFCYKKYFSQDPKWVLWNLREGVKSYTKMLIFEEEKWKKLSFVFLGYWHGLKGTMGNLPS